MLDKLHGKKTYLVCLAALVYVALGVWLGDLELAHAAEVALAALGAAGLRHSIK